MNKNQYKAAVQNLAHYNSFSRRRLRAIKYSVEHYGESEIKGAKHNAWIVKLFARIRAGWYTTDETPWCGALAADQLKYSLEVDNSFFQKKLGAAYKAVTAKEFLKMGEGISIEDAKPFDLMIISRNKGRGHHITWYYNHTATRVEGVGGNQGNQYKVDTYASSRILKIINLDDISVLQEDNRYSPNL